MREGARSLQRTGGAWITKPFTNWKMGSQKMKSHSKSEVHLLSCQLDVEADRARKEGSIISQFQNVGEQQRLQNRKAIRLLSDVLTFWLISTLHTLLTLTN